MTSQTLGDTLIAERACCRLVRLVVETWNEKELKEERCGWFDYQPPTAVGLHRWGQSHTPHKVGVESVQVS